MSARHLAISAGGTGGHMFPAQALAETMLARGWRITLMTDARGARYAGGFPEQVVVQRVASATFARGGAPTKLLAPLVIAVGIAAAKFRFLIDRPSAVVGFGGYSSIPALAAAWALRIPRMIHEQNGVLGRTNRLFARRVDKVACGTWPTTLPDGVSALHTGNPVRAQVLDRAAAAYEIPERGPFSILVIGGSQGARILSQVVPPAIVDLKDLLAANVRVAHQARPEDLARVKAAYESACIEADVEPFFADIARRIENAHLAIGRAGASTVADICVIGRPSILIPYPAAAADHQTANARSLADADAAILVPEAELDPAALTKQMQGVLGTVGTASRMRDNALRLAKPDAASRLASAIEHVAGV